MSNRKRTFPDNVEQWFKKLKGDSKDSESTRRSQLGIWMDWLFAERGKELYEATHTDVEDYIVEMRAQGYAETTYDNHKAAISEYYQWAIPRDDTNIDQNPAENIDITDYVDGDTVEPKKRQILRTRGEIYAPSTSEVDLMIEHAISPRPRNQLIIKLLKQTGIRGKELMRVKVDDIDRKKRQIDVDSAKKHEDRDVWYRSNLDLPLKQWIDGGDRLADTRYPKSPYLFPTNGGEHISRHRINEIVRDSAVAAGRAIDPECTPETNPVNPVIGKRASGIVRKHRDWDEDYRNTGEYVLRKYGAHHLRHYYGTYCANGPRGKTGSKMPIHLLRRLMGHKSIEMTERYISVDNDILRNAQDQYGPY
jgi:integrase/recombinase XerD